MNTNIVDSRRSKHLCVYCGVGIAAEYVKRGHEVCPKCGKRTIAPRGKNHGEFLDRPPRVDISWWLHGRPKSVIVRNYRKKIAAGETLNGMPLIERDGIVWGWDDWSFDKRYAWHALTVTRSAFVAEYKYIRSFERGKWRFCITAARKGGEIQELEVKFDTRRKLRNVDYPPVIAEAAKWGFNVTADFLSEQVKNINYGFKQNRFLPDGSGAVFSPIRDNGIQFRFAPIGADDREYIA